jgi:outer membrane lipoprotein-sorting protein
MINKVFRSFWILLFLLPLFSCGFKKLMIANPGFSSADIKASTFCRMNDNDTLSALAQIKFHTSKGLYSVKAALIIKRPSYLRVELLPVIGAPDFLLTISPEKMKILIPSKGEFYNGLPTVENIKKFLPWPMAIEDMIMILTGMYPSFQETNVSSQMHREDKIVRLEMKASSGCSQTIWLGEHNKLSKIIRYDDTGEEIYHVHYTYNNNDRECPVDIIINMADGITSLSIKYSDVKIEQQADLSIFDLSIPDNVKEFTLE